MLFVWFVGSYDKGLYTISRNNGGGGSDSGGQHDQQNPTDRVFALTYSQVTTNPVLFLK